MRKLALNVTFTYLCPAWSNGREVGWVLQLQQPVQVIYDVNTANIDPPASCWVNLIVDHW
jgi:hypothetical protein